MTQLQQPAWVYMQGDLVPWEQANLHISTEAVTRGLSVYEGLKGYWDEDDRNFGVIAVREHFERLRRSARLLHIPFDMSFAEFERAAHRLLGVLLTPGRDMWLRATVYVVEGHWGEGTVADLVLTAFHQPKARPEPISVGVSTWQRAGDAVLPPRVKMTSNYTMARLARIEGRPRGHSEMILLNGSGRVAEATGSCILMVRDGRVVTPPATEGRLEGITVDIVARICDTLGIPFMERPIDRTELYVADELACAGTLAEIVPIEQVDDFTLPRQRPVLDQVAERYWQAARGQIAQKGIERSFVSTSTETGMSSLANG